MDEKCPLVSVVMPAYNAERYITAAIESVQHQTISDFELIIVDDCSDDHTCMIAEELAKNDSRIRFLRNSENIGVARTRNRAFSLCRGSYVALLDSDDLWYPDKLEKQIQTAERTGADIVYCSYAIIDADNKQICADFMVPEKTDLEAMLAKSVISCSTALLTWTTAQEYLFPVDYYHEDYVYWLQLLQSGKRAVGVPDVLAAYRVSEHSRASNKFQSAKRRWQIYRSYLHFSCRKSTWYFAKYALNGLIKYKKT